LFRFKKGKDFNLFGLTNKDVETVILFYYYYYYDDDDDDKGDLKAETESEIVATQDQVLQTKYCATKILNTETDSKCRLCHQFNETIDQIISACQILAKSLRIPQ
jgi:hypothetical protein